MLAGPGMSSFGYIHTCCMYAFAHTHPSLHQKCFKNRHTITKTKYFRKRNADDEIVNKRFLVLPAFNCISIVNRTKMFRYWNVCVLVWRKWNSRKMMRHPFIVTFRQFKKRWRFHDSEDFCIVRELYCELSQLSRFPLWKYLK